MLQRSCSAGDFVLVARAVGFPEKTGMRNCHCIYGPTSDCSISTGSVVFYHPASQNLGDAWDLFPHSKSHLRLFCSHDRRSCTCLTPTNAMANLYSSRSYADCTCPQGSPGSRKEIRGRIFELPA